MWKLERYNEGIEKMRFTSNIYAKSCFDSNGIICEIWENVRVLPLFNSWGSTLLVFTIITLKSLHNMCKIMKWATRNDWSS